MPAGGCGQIASFLPMRFGIAWHEPGLLDLLQAAGSCANHSNRRCLPGCLSNNVDWMRTCKRTCTRARIISAAIMSTVSVAHAAFAGVATDGTVGPKQTLQGPNFNVLPSLGKQVGG